jgi:hypothetical protein
VEPPGSFRAIYAQGHEYAARFALTNDFEQPFQAEGLCAIKDRLGVTVGWVAVYTRSPFCALLMVSSYSACKKVAAFTRACHSSTLLENASGEIGVWIPHGVDMYPSAWRNRTTPP